MKKEDYLKLGAEEELAAKLAEASAEELKGFIPKARFDEVNNQLKAQKDLVADREKQIEALEGASGDAEKYKKDLEDLKAQIAKEKEEAERKAKEAEIEADYKNRFNGLAGENKWRDELTEKAVYAAFKEALADENNKGKGDREIFEALTKDKNYWENPNPMDMTGLGNGNTGGSVSEADILRLMGMPDEVIKELNN